MHREILLKTPDSEITFTDLCNKEYKRINRLLNMIESEFYTDMNLHPDIKHEILNISNFVRRLPTMVSEVISNDIKT